MESRGWSRPGTLKVWSVCDITRQAADSGQGRDDRAGGTVQGVELTVGKNVKLEKDHVPLHQADHWVWDLGHRLLQACSLTMPLQLGAGHGWSWRVWGRKAEGHGPVWGHRHYLSSPPCIVPTLSHVPVRSSASPEALASRGRPSCLALATRPLPGDVATAPTATLSVQPGLQPDCWVSAYPGRNPACPVWRQ